MKLGLFILTLIGVLPQAAQACDPGAEYGTLTRIWFSLTRNSTGQGYNTLLGFVPNGQETIDGCDASYPFLNEPNHFMIFSYSNETPWQIQALPLLTESRDITLGHQTPDLDLHTINIYGADNFEMATSIVLEDTLTGDTQDLLSGSYSFFPAETQNLNRFIVHIYVPGKITTNISVQNQQLNLSTVGKGNYEVTDISGRIVLQGAFQNAMNIPITDLPLGSYVARVRAGRHQKHLTFIKRE